MTFADPRQEKYSKTERGRATRKRCYREWADKNRDKLNGYMRKWWASLTPEERKERQRKVRFKSKYGITPEQYDRMLAAQGGHCALCDRTPEQELRYKRLNVDHCHETGRVRGLLCNRCNSGLAALGDNERGLSAALEYLRQI